MAPRARRAGWRRSERIDAGRAFSILDGMKRHTSLSRTGSTFLALSMGWLVCLGATVLASDEDKPTIPVCVVTGQLVNSRTSIDRTSTVTVAALVTTNGTHIEVRYYERGAGLSEYGTWVSMGCGDGAVQSVYRRASKWGMQCRQQKMDVQRKPLESSTENSRWFFSSSDNGSRWVAIYRVKDFNYDLVFEEPALATMAYADDILSSDLKRGVFLSQQRVNAAKKHQPKAQADDALKY